MTLTARETHELEAAIATIVEKGEAAGLDFFEMRYEICPADIIYTFGAYAMPIRFSHWSFGKSFHRMKMDYDYGMSKIYELVINSDPCYAFLLDSNSLLQNKLIAAHVLAHCDFFKNNWRFKDTNRKMISSMTAFANRVREYEQEFGRKTVEQFLDDVLAIQEHIDPFPSKDQPAADRPKEKKPTAGSEYDDLWALGTPAERAAAANAPPPNPVQPTLPPGSTRDLLQFLMRRAPDLQEWQRDILSCIRDESLYFRPQMETKIMNEGWASFWHARIMRDLDLTADESVEFARMHASVLAPNRYQLNPYHLGFHMFTDLFEKHGMERIYEIRHLDTDVSFIRNYLTEELVEKLDLYIFKKSGDQWEVSHNRRQWEMVRDGIVASISNSGIPYIYAVSSDYQKRGELFLQHGFEGVELDAKWLTKTLVHMFHIWGRPVHLETVEDDRRVCYSCTADDAVDRTVL